MKVGMVFECGPRGADEKVYIYLAKKLNPSIVIVPTPLDSKRKLIKECADQAKALLEIEDCEMVIIIWDLQPHWEEAKKTLCVVDECKIIRNSLDKAGLTVQQKQRVHLVCIEQALETLLLADERAIEVYLNERRKEHPCKVNHFKHPEHLPKPKGILRKIFQDVGRTYEDWRDAEEIIRRADIDKIWRCESFARFADKVAGIKRS